MQPYPGSRVHGLHSHQSISDANMTPQPKEWTDVKYDIADSSDIRQDNWSSRKVYHFTCVACLGILVLVSTAITCLLWLTTAFDDILHSGLLYREGSPFFTQWLAPPFTAVTKLYVYNYTNVDEFLHGRAKKLRVHELGPYSYTETLEHVNVQFHNNDTFSFREKRRYEFKAEWSNGNEEDLVVVPNLPLICAISRVRDEPYVAQMGLRSALWLAGGSAFSTLRIKDYFFGYNDTLYEMAKNALHISGSGTLPKLGILAPRVGVSDNLYTVYTGQANYSQLDVVDRVNGRADLGAWGSEGCDRMDGSAGTFFPAQALRDRKPVHLFNADVCRRIDLEFKREVKVMHGVPALRYGPPSNFWDNVEDNPGNACFVKSDYPNLPSGVFLNGPCYLDSPSFLSFPRFYLGDPMLREAVEGIEQPNPENHSLHFDLSPDLGMNLGAAMRLQINVMIRKAEHIPAYLDSFQDQVIIPVLWFETVLKDFPEEAERITFHVTVTFRCLERVLMYGCPVLAVLCALLLARRLAAFHSAGLQAQDRKGRHQPLPVHILRVD